VTNGAHLPVTALIDQFYSRVQAMGGKRWDTSSLIALIDNGTLVQLATTARTAADTLIRSAIFPYLFQNA
jgi:hypothetical protein